LRALVGDAPHAVAGADHGPPDREGLTMLQWKWDFAWAILPRLIDATGKTLIAAGGGFAVALVLGLVLALGQRTRVRALTVITRELVEFVRSTPLLLQVFFVYYVGPQFGLRLSPWT